MQIQKHVCSVRQDSQLKSNIRSTANHLLVCFMQYFRHIYTKKCGVYLKLSFNQASCVVFYLLNYTTQSTLLNEKKQIAKPYV